MVFLQCVRRWRGAVLLGALLPLLAACLAGRTVATPLQIDACKRQEAKIILRDRGVEPGQCTDADGVLDFACLDMDKSGFWEMVATACLAPDSTSVTLPEWAAEADDEPPVEADDPVPTVDPADLAEPEGSGTLLSLTHRSVPVNCTQEPSGHFFSIACDFALTVSADYEATVLPAFFTCRAKGQGVAGRGYGTLELTTLTGTAELTFDATNVRAIYEDKDGNGAADTVGDEDGVRDNPDPADDGMYTQLTCWIGPVESDSFAWETVDCAAEDEPGGLCNDPWLSLADAHAWD